MEKRLDKKTGAEVSLLGFGCMRFPVIEPGKPEIDEVRALEMIDKAYQSGVNYFDTAYPYHEGLSESFMGKALSQYDRQSYYLATKMPTWLLKSKEDAERIFAEQLKKLQTDYFDFYLCHAIGQSDSDYIDAYEKTGVYDYLVKLKRQGAIRRLGFSFHGTPERLERLVNLHDWDFVQLQINYLDWTMQKAKEQYEILEKKGIPCIVMEPVRGGALVSLCEESVEILKEADGQNSTASWAIRFAASLPGVLTVLSGMSTLEQVKDNVKTLTQFKPLNEGQQKALSRALQAYLSAGTIACTGCRYCMDCPAGVDIPGVFALYNRCATERRIPVLLDKEEDANQKAAFVKTFEELPEQARMDHCISCGKCVEHCPQGIKIPERMHEIAELMRAAQGTR